MEDYYVILGLDKDASSESIKIAFRRRAREIHPDFQPGSSENQKAALSRQMAELNQAYDVLRDTERRRAYDEQLRMQALLTTKATRASNRPTATGAQTATRIRSRSNVDSSLVREFSDQLRSNLHTKCKDFSWKDRQLEGFDWALESSSWSSHSWVVLRALAAVQAATVKSFLTYADVAMTRNHSTVRASYFLFVLAFQQMHEWDAISLKCRRFVTPETRPGSSRAQAAILFLDVQNGKVLRFEAQPQGKLHEMIDKVAAHV